MSALGRAVVAGIWLVSVIIYLLAMAGAVPEIWSLMESTKAVTNGPWWDMAKRFKFIAVYLVPAVLILSPVLYWIYGAVREEANREVRRI